MLLYDYARSSAAYRVRIALNLKGVAYRREPVLLLENEQRTPEHLHRNPQGLVPALALDDGRVLTQSLAIIDWLDARFPEPRLIPLDPDARAAALARTMVIGADVHPLNNLRVQRYLKNEMGQNDAAREWWSRHWIALGLAALETMAGAGPMLGGDAPDISDVFLVPQLFNARRVGLDLTPYPRLCGAEAAAGAIPAFAQAHPDR
jgi:maleylacetoacetate isomerase